MTTTALMIDIETLALTPDAVVLQIGYCVADLDTRTYHVQPTSIHLDPYYQNKRAIDFGTLQWWMKQDRAVADTVFSSEVQRTWVSSAEDEFEDLVRKYPDMTVWASPAMFDLPILTSLWGDKPWKYNMERDMMTFRKLMDPDGLLKPPDNTRAHDAAADAHWQMEYLMNLWAHRARIGAPT